MNDRIRPDLNRPPVQHVGEHRVTALSLSGLRDLLRDYGVDHRPILDEAGLSLDMETISPGSRLSDSKER